MSETSDYRHIVQSDIMENLREEEVFVFVISLKSKITINCESFQGEQLSPIVEWLDDRRKVKFGIDSTTKNRNIP